MLAACFPLTGTVYCYTDNSKERAITENEHRFCTSSYSFTRKRNGRYSVSNQSFWYADVDSKWSVFCEIFDDSPPREHEIIGRGRVRDSKIAAVKKGTATCYCNTSIICATQGNTLKVYINKADRMERKVLQQFLKLDVPEAVDELHKFMATSLPKATTEPSPSTGEGVTVTVQIEKQSSDTSPGAYSENPGASNQEGQRSDANAALDKSHDDSSSPNLLLILGLGALVVLIIIVIIALVPILIKYRQKRRKRWLEKTWDQRVKKAGEELEKVEKERKEKEEKERKSKGEGSQDSATPNPSDGGRDPFGAFVSKMGHLDEKGAGL
uniref:Uncharacterized protein n=1 Tax=Haemonchus contortus TaxID=6289 RepID=A0A7I4YZV6_HAECO